MVVSNRTFWLSAAVLCLSATLTSAMRTLLEDPPCNPCFSADGSSSICCNGGQQCGPVEDDGTPTCTEVNEPPCNPCYSANGSSHICCNGPSQCGPQLRTGAPTCVPVIAPKVIIDTDFNTIGDDGQALAMAAQLYAQGVIDILGITIATGNEWRDQEVVEALKAVERLGISSRVGVYVGANEPVRHTYENYLLQVSSFGDPTDYVGAYASTPPNSTDLVAPPDGFATDTVPGALTAVDFIIAQVRKYPGEVTILEIAPPTNLAAALEKDPEIAPLIKQIITMSGQIYVPGNSYQDVAEFNWWFDPDATRVVLRTAIPRVIIPLDTTNTIPVTVEVFKAIANYSPPTAITQLYRDVFDPFFGPGPPPYSLYIFDTLALAYLVDPSLATDVRELYVDVNTDFSADYGKSVVHPEDPTGGSLEKSRVVFGFDTDRFFALYVDLLTRPVPVSFAP